MSCLAFLRYPAVSLQGGSIFQSTLLFTGLLNFKGICKLSQDHGRSVESSGQGQRIHLLARRGASVRCCRQYAQSCAILFSYILPAGRVYGLVCETVCLPLAEKPGSRGLFPLSESSVQHPWPGSRHHARIHRRFRPGRSWMRKETSTHAGECFVPVGGGSHESGWPTRTRPSLRHP